MTPAALNKIAKYAKATGQDVRVILRKILEQQKELREERDQTKEPPK